MGSMIVHNCADTAIVVRMYGHNAPLPPVHLEPGEEMTIDAGYASRLRDIHPDLRAGSHKRDAVTVTPPPPASAPSSDPDEVGKLIAAHSKDELKAMAKELGVDIRGNLSEQAIAERIVAAMS
jgi:hypothetical protein